MIATQEDILQNYARLREENERLRAEVERLQELNERTYEISRERVSRERGKHKPKERSGFVFASKCAPRFDRFPGEGGINAWIVTLETPHDANLSLDDVQARMAIHDLPDLLNRLDVKFYANNDGEFIGLSNKELYAHAQELNDETAPCRCYRVTYEQDTRTRLWHVRLYLTKPLPRLDLY